MSVSCVPKSHLHAIGVLSKYHAFHCHFGIPPPLDALHSSRAVMGFPVVASVRFHIHLAKPLTHTLPPVVIPINARTLRITAAAGVVSRCAILRVPSSSIHRYYHYFSLFSHRKVVLRNRRPSSHTRNKAGLWLGAYCPQFHCCLRRRGLGPCLSVPVLAGRPLRPATDRRLASLYLTTS